MKVGIDAHAIGSRAGGNETYMRMLLRALREHAPETDCTIFARQDQYAALASEFGFPAQPIPVHSSYLRVPFVLPWMAARAKVDLLHIQYTAPPVCPCPYVVSMHDAVALRFPESMPFFDRHRLRLLGPRTLRRAARIFVLTNAMRDEIAERHGIAEDRFDLVQPALDSQFQRVDDPERLAETRRKYGLPEHYILFLGLLQPRKNLVRLATAFARLQDRGFDHKLVIVGKRAWLYGAMLEKIEALDLGERIVFTGYVDDQDLPALYSCAEVFAYVSLYEGFGIPVLEAMACGCPVLTSTDPALREVTGEAALHADPMDEGAIEDGLARLLTEEDLRKRLRAAGLHRAGEFTAEKMAGAALAGYRAAF